MSTESSTDMDEERRNLERAASEGDESAVQRLVAMNDRRGLTEHDADYLQQFLAICERAIDEPASAEKALRTLNEEFRFRITSATIRDEIPTVSAYRRGKTDGYEEGREDGYDAAVPWSSSQDCP